MKSIPDLLSTDDPELETRRWVAAWAVNQNKINAERFDKLLQSGVGSGSAAAYLELARVEAEACFEECNTRLFQVACPTEDLARHSYGLVASTIESAFEKLRNHLFNISGKNWEAAPIRRLKVLFDQWREQRSAWLWGWLDRIEENNKKAAAVEERMLAEKWIDEASGDYKKGWKAFKATGIFPSIQFEEFYAMWKGIKARGSGRPKEK